ncbi:hypothetical protein ANCCAN_06620 [Ancylostoma caninum]|uniref:DUF5600 domain-containing protein n=1 Tax=Ancylostoma caninum TaxID=29170 RepID=A0A368GSG7_ANCCA|nr:hypothetical protein ANCCAN_06620 [Ancylostoma caninum]
MFSWCCWNACVPDLFQDLQALPRNAALRKLNYLIRRARLAKVHAFIISELRKSLDDILCFLCSYEQLQRKHNVSLISQT